MAVAVNLELPAAMPTLKVIDGFPLHEMEMAVPPLMAASIRAMSTQGARKGRVCSMGLPQHSQVSHSWTRSGSAFGTCILRQKDLMVLGGSPNSCAIFL